MRSPVKVAAAAGLCHIRFYFQNVPAQFYVNCCSGRNTTSIMFQEQRQSVTQITKRLRLEGSLRFLQYTDSFHNGVAQLRTARAVEQLARMRLYRLVPKGSTEMLEIGE